MLGQTGRQPAETTVFGVAGLRAEGGIGDLGLGPDNTLPLPRVSGSNKGSITTSAPLTSELYHEHVTRRSQKSP